MCYDECVWPFECHGVLNHLFKVQTTLWHIGTPDTSHYRQMLPSDGLWYSFEYIPWFRFVCQLCQTNFMAEKTPLLSNQIEDIWLITLIRNQIKFSFTYRSSDFYRDTLWMVLPGLNTGDSMTLDQMNLKNAGLPLSFRCADRIISSSSCISKFGGYIGSRLVTF